MMSVRYGPRVNAAAVQGATNDRAARYVECVVSRSVEIQAVIIAMVPS